MAARYVNDIQIAKAHRDFQLKKAAYDKEVLTKKAASELAYDLQVGFGRVCACVYLFACGCVCASVPVCVYVCVRTNLTPGFQKQQTFRLIL